MTAVPDVPTGTAFEHDANGHHWTYHPSAIGFWQGWWVFKDGQDIHVSIDKKPDGYQVDKWWGLLPNIEGVYRTLAEATTEVEGTY